MEVGEVLHTDCVPAERTAAKPSRINTSMSKFSTYDVAGPGDPTSDILMIGQGADEKVLKLVSPAALVSAATRKQFGGMCAGKSAPSEIIFSMFAPYAAP